MVSLSVLSFSDTYSCFAKALNNSLFATIMEKYGFRIKSQSLDCRFYANSRGLMKKLWVYVHLMPARHWLRSLLSIGSERSLSDIMTLRISRAVFLSWSVTSGHFGKLFMWVYAFVASAILVRELTFLMF